MGQDEKVYLGDGAYLEFDGYQLVITTSNGSYDTNRICLEPEVFQELIRHAKKIKGFELK